MRNINFKIYNIYVLIILILLTLPNTLSVNKEDMIGYDTNFNAKPPCWTQSQQSCLFTNLIPFIFVTVVIGLFIYLKYEKKILRIPKKRKILLFLIVLSIFYLGCVLLLKFFWAKNCV